MLNNKDVGFNDATQTLTINGKKHQILGGGGGDTGHVISHDFDTDEPFVIEASGALIAWGYDQLADPSDEPGEFLYILGSSAYRIVGNGCVTFTKTATGWRATPEDGTQPLLYFYIP